ncbi:MAG: glutathione peroxidase [Candidatus Hydrogenedentes bacterium]|nr:glutathione peroxidase [Candidatus Hydrogenedentota bacterium]
MDCSVTRANGESSRLGDRYAGKVLLIVNVASKCGFTSQYEALQKLHERYSGQGFAVLGFPCNEFGGQEPGTNDEIRTFCDTHYRVTFELFDKTGVSGGSAASLYRALTLDTSSGLGGPIRWNFTKFLVGRDGRVKARIEPPTPPDASSVVKLIERELATEWPPRV